MDAEIKAEFDRLHKSLSDISAVIAERTVRIVGLENSEWKAESGSTTAPAPVPTPAPVTKEPTPTVTSIRAYIRLRFIALTTANGYPGGRVPGEEPVGVIRGGAMDSWVAFANNLLSSMNSAAAYADLDRAIAADVATYYPKIDG